MNRPPFDPDLHGLSATNKPNSSTAVIVLSIGLVIAVGVAIFLGLKWSKCKKCDSATNPLFSLTVDGKAIANTGVFPYTSSTTPIKQYATLPSQNTGTFILGVTSPPSNLCDTQAAAFYLKPVVNQTYFHLVFMGTTIGGRDMGKVVVATQTAWTDAATNANHCGTYLALGDAAKVDSATIVQITPNMDSDGNKVFEAVVPYEFSGNDACKQGPLKGYLGVDTLPSGQDWLGQPVSILAGPVLTILSTPSIVTTTPAPSPFDKC